MTTRFAVLLAVVAGLAVGNLYWAQPLLADIAADFGVSADRGGLLVTATQLGYALGILFIVPLGDIMSKRTILLGVTTLAIVFLALCAAAPSLWHLGAALIGMGICTVSGQIIVPLAGDLAEANTRGRIVGSVGHYDRDFMLPPAQRRSRRHLGMAKRVRRRRGMQPCRAGNDLAESSSRDGASFYLIRKVNTKRYDSAAPSPCSGSHSHQTGAHFRNML